MRQSFTQIHAKLLPGLPSLMFCSTVFNTMFLGRQPSETKAISKLDANAHFYPLLLGSQKESAASLAKFWIKERTLSRPLENCRKS